MTLTHFDNQGNAHMVDVSDKAVTDRIAVAKAQVRMPNGPIKMVGDSSVSVQLHTDVVVDINVTVYGETA